MRLIHHIIHILQKFSDRPAIGIREFKIKKTINSDKAALYFLPSYKTLTYNQLLHQIETIASEWHYNTANPIKEGDKVAILGFISADYIAIDITCVRLGLIAIHLQTSAEIKELDNIIKETHPTILISSIENIDKAIQLAQQNTTIKRLIIFDYFPQLDAHIKKIQQVNHKEQDRKLTFSIEILNEIIIKANALPVAPFPDETKRDPITMLVYTSGSTGTPKGAVYTEKLVAGIWTEHLLPNLSSSLATTLHYFPMDHAIAHTLLKNILSRGGICYLTAKHDLSCFLDDLQLSKPTDLFLIPRMCELIYQQYQLLLAKNKSEHPLAVEEEMLFKENFRVNYLGGQVRWAGYSSAPITNEMHQFMQSVLGVTLHNIYGLTEAGIISFDNQLLEHVIVDYKLVDVPELGYFKTDKPYPRGELFIKPKAMISSYYNQPDLNKTLFDQQGFYATADIVEELNYRELRLIDRRKKSIKLSQGEFISLHYIERILGESPLIEHIFIYAESTWSTTLAVIVPTPTVLVQYKKNKNSVKKQIKQSLHYIAINHHFMPYEIPRDFIIEEIPFNQQQGLVSDFNKPLWHKLKQRYYDDLQALYLNLTNSPIPTFEIMSQNHDKHAILKTIIQIAHSLLGELDNTTIGPHSCFYNMGGDSLTTVYFSNVLAQLFNVKIPIEKIVNPIFTLNDIADYIKAQQISPAISASFNTIHGDNVTTVYAEQLKLDYFLDKDLLINAHHLSSFQQATKMVLLTGANGFLGRFICLQLMQTLSQIGGKLICLIRAKSNEEAKQRLCDVYSNSDKQLLTQFNQLAAKCLVVLAGDIAAQQLGLNNVTWQYLTENIETIYHIGGLVNHVLPYSDLFNSNVVSTAEIIRLALTHHKKQLIFTSSIAVATTGDINEITDIRTLLSQQNMTNDYANGYAISKWASEVLLTQAHEHYQLPITVYRPSLILAHSQYKMQLNIDDMFTRLLISLCHTQIAPNSFYQSTSQNISAHFDGLPVEFVALAITQLAQINKGEYLTYHLVNPHQDGISLDTVVNCLIEAGFPIRKRVNYCQWRDEFEQALYLLPDTIKNYSYLPLLSSIQNPQMATAGSAVTSAQFQSAMQSLSISIPQLTKHYINKYIEDLTIKNLL